MALFDNIVDDTSGAEQCTNVYVSNLPLTITIKKFRLLFGAFGTVIGVRLVPRRKGHAPVGFVQFTTNAMALEAIAAMHGKEFEGSCLSVTLARRDKDKGIHNQPSAILYVANLPQKLNEGDIQKLFSKFGSVLSVRLLRYPDTGASKGIALVRFSSLDHAMTAKDAMHCTVMHKNGLPLEVKYAESKEERLSRRDEAQVEKAKKDRKPKSRKASSPTSPTNAAVPPETALVEEWMDQWLQSDSTALWTFLDDGPDDALPRPLLRSPSPPRSQASSCGSASDSAEGDGPFAPTKPGATGTLLLSDFPADIFRLPSQPEVPPAAEDDEALASQFRKLEELSRLLALHAA
eukprot:EG_transcript_13296